MDNNQVNAASYPKSGVCNNPNNMDPDLFQLLCGEETNAANQTGQGNLNQVQYSRPVPPPLPPPNYYTPQFSVACPTCPACPTQAACPACPTCPAIPQADYLHTVNVIAQAGSVAPTTIPVLLGTGYQSPNGDITYVSPTLINLNSPGLYRFYVQTNLLLDLSTNQIVIFARYNTQVVAGSYLYLTNIPDGDITGEQIEFYIYNQNTGTVQLFQSASTADESIVDFAVTVIKVQIGE